MAQKCLIIYASRTGNTEKVALRFKSTFEKNGWECDIFKIDQNTDIFNLPFDLKNYDFLCAGSGVKFHLPYDEILNVIRKLIYGVDPRLPMPPPPTPKPGETTARGDRGFKHRKIVLGADCKKSVVFITYAGYEFGPKEAEPALKLLELEIEHLEFKCIGNFCCPGKFVNTPTPETFHGDIRGRPNERDLLKAEMFIEEKLEEIADRTR